MNRILKTIRLLANNLSDRPLGIDVTMDAQTPEGIAYDLYQPARAAAATVIVVYGLDLAGETDSRLVRFASACASAGLRAAVPHLAGLKSYCFSQDDIQAIAGLAESLHRRFSSPIGVIGFSAGGSYALLAAGRGLEWIDPIVLFSPYYSLDGTPPIRRPKDKAQLVTDSDWDYYLWCQFIGAFRSLDRSDFSAAERAEVIEMLGEFCNAGLERKRQVYQKLLASRPPYEISESLFAGQDLSPFSLAGKLGQVRGRVFLLHDPNDDMIPPEHSRCILAELEQRGPPAVQDLLVTNLISHVMPAYHFHPSEGIKVIRMLSHLFPR